MSRTPLFGALRRQLSLARLGARRGTRDCAALVEEHRTLLDRREFLKQSIAGGGVLALSGCASTPALKASQSQPRIAIIGAGIAGLNCAWHLRRKGYLSTIYEASSRSGGRIYTASNLLGEGLTTELGGEFIDSDHKEMLSLARHFRLDLLDFNSARETRNYAQSYFFGGRHYSEAEVVEAFLPIAPQMSADFDAIGDISYRAPEAAGPFDRMSVAEYLDQRCGSGWFRDLLEVAYVTEYGLDAGDQSALNLIFLIGLEPERRFEIFGDSDERFKIAGGNQRVVDALAVELREQIRNDHRLLAIASNGAGYTLTLQQSGAASSTEVQADVVVLTLPFTLLREVKIDVPLPEAKLRAIKELGYGNSTKLLVGTQRRVWQEQGRNGECFSDNTFQLCWDNSRLQPGDSGGMTLYSGGQLGLEVGSGTPESQVKRRMGGLDAVFPGVAAAVNGKVSRFHWPTHEFTRGGYSCYRPGQWGSICGAESESVGNLHFAGEHCSLDFQGFMEGGAETGRAAAETILESVGQLVSA